MVYRENEISAGVLYNCAKTDTGFAAEVAVPVSYLNQKQGAPWSEVRVSIAANDLDDG